MGRPRKIELSFEEKIRRIKNAGIISDEKQVVFNDNLDETVDKEIHGLNSLKHRIEQILNLVRQKPVKAKDMVYMIMYDIENNKIRGLIAKYLLQKGCIRIQKSVYMARTTSTIFNDLKVTLREIQECYENNDSIIFIPILVNTPGSMEVIGKDIQIDLLVDKPNTLFF